MRADVSLRANLTRVHRGTATVRDLSGIGVSAIELAVVDLERDVRHWMDGDATAHSIEGFHEHFKRFVRGWQPDPTGRTASADGFDLRLVPHPNHIWTPVSGTTPTQR